jgi:2-polyprenyl-6-methoxyphenol hydroxylase-like FAD-dependent oxidoreductase
MQTEAVGLLEESGRVVGVKTKTVNGEMEIRAALTVGADGRSSLVRDRSGLEVIDLGAPMDIVWFRMSRHGSDPPQTLGYTQSGKILVMINREDYWQSGYVIAKGAFDEIRNQGIENFRRELADLVPFLSDRVSELRDWKDVSLLTVKVDRLRKWWRPGLLCIGDAAHAMSPIGGVGINLAIQDAVGAANILAPKLSANQLTDRDLEAVQKRRELPTRVTQKVQVLIQNNVIGRVLASDHALSVPWPIKLLQVWPALRRIPARAIGMGFRPEHIRTLENLPHL